MKNSIKAITAATLLTILFSRNLNAQEISAGVAGQKNYAPNGMVSSENKNILNTSSIISSGTIDVTNPKLLTQFSALFPAATKQQWALNDKSFWVSFLNNDRKASASFTQKGKLNYVITDCTIEQLPDSFRKTISKDYASYHLNNAIEIKAYESVAYQAILENESSYVTLKFTSEGVEKIQHINKTIN